MSDHGAARPADGYAVAAIAIEKSRHAGQGGSPVTFFERERSRMARGVIFDVDGTLVDSVDLHAQAWQDAFRMFGHDIDLPAIRSQIGKGGDQLLPVFTDREELAAIGTELEERRGDILRERYLHKVTAFPRVRDLFERLREDGIKVALASSAKEAELAFYIRVAGTGDPVDVETSADDAAKSKPHPDIFEAAVSRLHFASTDLVVIGDTPYDAEAAELASFVVAGFDFGSASRCGEAMQRSRRNRC